jgi:hypothetical protein
MLGLAVPARALLLCWSVHGIVSDARTRMVFQPYFLAPFGMAVAVLVLELGIVSRRRTLLRAAMLLPVLVACLTLFGYRADMIQGFRGIFAGRLGADPLIVTLLASACFYGYAGLRRVPLAIDALSGALLALALVGFKSLPGHPATGPDASPLLAAATLQLVAGLFRRNGLRSLVGTTGLAIGSALIVTAPDDTTSFYWLVAFHLQVAGLLALGAAFRGRFGQLLRAAAATLMAVACLAATFGKVNPDLGLPLWMIAAYPPLAITVLSAYCLLLRDRRPLAAAAVAGIAWLAAETWRGYEALLAIIPGLNHIALSLALFAVALVVSLGKAGVLSRWFGPESGPLPGVATVQGVVENVVQLSQAEGPERFRGEP